MTTIDKTGASDAEFRARVAAFEARWLPVVGYEGYYEVSEYGDVRSVDRMVLNRGRLLPRRGQPIRATLNKEGRPSVYLSRYNETRTVHVQGLVLEAFVGPRPDGFVCCHNDGNAANNHVSNLRWDTQSANARDAVLHGVNVLAKRTHCNYGHPFSGDNLRLSGRKRICRTCRRASDRKRRARVATPGGVQ